MGGGGETSSEGGGPPKNCRATRSSKRSLLDVIIDLKSRPPPPVGNPEYAPEGHSNTTVLQEFVLSKM